MTITQRSDYTFKYNKTLGRHGWLRLTPAYSVKLVKEYLEHLPKHKHILDPFSGTGTTSLVALQHGFQASCFDINPFLIWFGQAKCYNYTSSDCSMLAEYVEVICRDCEQYVDIAHWLPDIHNIERWWDRGTLHILGTLRYSIVTAIGEPNTTSFALIWIAFCRLIIETSAAAFNHVSMSFQDEVATFHKDHILELFNQIFHSMLNDCMVNHSGTALFYLQDSCEEIREHANMYSHVITSPPYPNRMSYIRELRPYMYWTKFLQSSPQAAHIDWQAIGGTWGSATSKLKNWSPSIDCLPIQIHDVVEAIFATNEKNAELMGKYVWKYFHDIDLHIKNIRHVLKNNARLYYIVGNSSFYGVRVQTEKLYELLFKNHGFQNVESAIIRKRNSKKELFEYCVSAEWHS